MRSRSLVALGLALAACSDGPTQPDLPELGRRLSVGEQTVCALIALGEIRCWGANTSNLEYGADVAARAAPTSLGLPLFSSLSVSASQSMCGITPGKKALCWGRGGLGQLGGGSDGDAGNAPVAVAGDLDWSTVSLGRLISCGVDATATAHCWGLNQWGEVGNPAFAPATRVSTPTPIATTVQFSKIAAGWLHACGLSLAGDVYCWGENKDGQLGRGSVDSVANPEPAKIAGTRKYIAIAVSARSSCAIAADSTAWCWGVNTFGQLGDGSVTHRAAPTPVATTHKFASIAMSSGFGGGGSEPVPIITGLQAGGPTHTCALTAEGAAWCWGWNAYGQLGNGNTIHQATPVAVLGDLRFDVVGLGGTSTCGMQGNYVWCWGSNWAGQLGDGSHIDSWVPVSVATPFRKP